MFLIFKQRTDWIFKLYALPCYNNYYCWICILFLTFYFICINICSPPALVKQNNVPFHLVFWFLKIVNMILFWMMITQELSMYLKCRLEWTNLIIALSCCLSRSKKLIHSFQSAFQIHGKFLYYRRLSPHLPAYNRLT